jgi:DNA replication and repair protein RecF
MRCSWFQSFEFRNLKPQRLEWALGLNLLRGENGAGKTNLLEVLRLLSGWGPFRGRVASEAPRWGGTAGKAALKGGFSGEENLEIAAFVGRRVDLRRDGKPVGAATVRSRVPALSFTPEDLSLIEGPPAIRRRFLDGLCALLLPLYAFRLLEYRKALRQRTAALRQNRGVQATARVLAPLASWIWASRAAAVDLLRMGLSEVSELLPEPVEIAFSRGGSLGLEDGMEDFWASLARHAKVEERIGLPVVGPHRDELVIEGKGKPAVQVFSRGHRRRAAVALMMAAGWAVERKLRRAPVLLLDEVAAELDDAGRSVLVESLDARGWQVFAATAESAFDGWPGAVWRVSAGEVQRIS